MILGHDVESRALPLEVSFGCQGMMRITCADAAHLNLVSGARQVSRLSNDILGLLSLLLRLNLVALLRCIVLFRN